MLDSILYLLLNFSMRGIIQVLLSSLVDKFSDSSAAAAAAAALASAAILAAAAAAARPALERSSRLRSGCCSAASASWSSPDLGLLPLVLLPGGFFSPSVCS
uniref:Uncharacterized protein n=1 Tax=Phlebotomus papatasi TaxID=29031 RepID=A0A1B0EWM9_PHLPP